MSVPVNCPRCDWQTSRRTAAAAQRAAGAHRCRPTRPTPSPAAASASGTAAAQAPRFRSAEQAAWYGGRFPAGGASRTPTAIPRAGDCPTAGCGDPVEPSGQAPEGWVSTAVSGSREPARRWCSGSCATYGIALAELRVGSGPA